MKTIQKSLPLWQTFRSLTPYQYAYNSPLSYKDPTGLYPEKEKGDRVLGIAGDPRAESYIQVIGVDYAIIELKMEQYKAKLQSKYEPLIMCFQNQLVYGR